MPLSFVVFVGLIALVVIAPLGLRLAGAVLGRRRQLCPGCGEKALAMTAAMLAPRTGGDEDTTQPRTSWTEHECDRCCARYVKPFGEAMLPRQAWLATPASLPTAIVVQRED